MNAPDPRAEPPVASWSQAGIGTYSVYRDGAIERECWTPEGREVVTESIVGATARVERFGARMLFRDSRRAFLSIEGPHVAIAVRINNYPNVAASVQRFADQINELAHQLAPTSDTAEPHASIPAQLVDLAHLRDTGVLTNEEFESKKRQLLDEL